MGYYNIFRHQKKNCASNFLCGLTTAFHNYMSRMHPLSNQSIPSDLPAYRDDIATPALVLDLDRFESNLKRMADFLKQSRIDFRPHAKTHKCPAIAKKQMELGATGICVAKLSEAEVMFASGIDQILITSEITSQSKIAKLMDLAKRCAGLMVVVDDPRLAHGFAETADARKVKLNVLIDIDGGNHRTGCLPGKPALHLAEMVSRARWLELRGIQCYAGQVAHAIDFEARKQDSQEALSRALESRDLIERQGIPIEMLTGGSTGTYNIDPRIQGFTELQAGSYIFMDLDYHRIRTENGGLFLDFQFALTVLTTVISKAHSKLATVDGGFKAFATDKPFVPELKNFGDVQFRWAGDEHGILELKEPYREIKLNDRLEFLIPHCDPTVNLYDWIYAVRGERVEGIWPVAARGRSQ